MESRSLYSTGHKCFTFCKKKMRCKTMSQTADFQDSDDQENRGILVMVFRIEENVRRSGKQDVIMRCEIHWDEV